MTAVELYQIDAGESLLPNTEHRPALDRRELLLAPPSHPPKQQEH